MPVARLIARCLAATLAALALAGASAARAQGQGPAADGPALMIVFDGSGSMWGRIEGVKISKFATARDAIDAALAKAPANAVAGLASSGRRGGGSCGDAEVMIAPQTDPRGAIGGVLEKLNPRGRGPIVETLRLATQALGSRRPASLIVIHDDADNCQQNACEAAADLAKSQPGMKVHVISMGLKREELAQVACLATSTGGRHFDAMTAEEATTGIDTAIRLALGAAAPVARQPAGAIGSAQTPAAPAEAAPAAAAATSPAGPLTGPPGLRLSAHLSAGANPLATPVQWRVTRAGQAGGEAVHEATAVLSSVDLPPGAYAVVAKVGLATATQTFVVPATGPVRAAVVLDAGALKLETRAQKGGPAIDNVTYTVRAAEGADRTAAAAGEIRWLGRDPAEPLILPPGTYHVRAERGFAFEERIVTVPVGSSGAADFALGAGLLTLRAAAEDGGTAFTTALFIVSEDDPESPRGRREVARSAAPSPDFVLPAGTYHVVVRIGATEVREQVAVGAGESVKRTVLIGMGRLDLSARVDAPATTQAGRDAVSFQVTALDGGAREIGRYSTSPQTVELPAGAYRIDAQIGGQNVRASQRVQVAAGRSTRVAFDLEAARITLRVAPTATGSGLADVFWEIADAKGGVVWRTGQIEPRVVLAPGRYTVTTQLRESSLRDAFEVRPGEARTVEIGRAR